MSCKKNQEKRRKWDLSRVRENGWGSNVRCCGRMGYYMCLWNRGYTLPGLWCFDKEWQLLKGDLRAELNFNNHIGSKQRSDTSFFFLPYQTTLISFSCQISLVCESCCILGPILEASMQYTRDSLAFYGCQRWLKTRLLKSTFLLEGVDNWGALEVEIH